MVAKITSAKLKGAAPLSQAEAALVEGVVLTRPKGWFSRFKQGIAYAAKVVTREEFDRICLSVVKDLDGQAIDPWDAARKARRLIEAYTQAHATVHMPKCDVTDQAVMVAWLGEPHAGFLFQRALKLKDPKAVSRG